jgi:hypothetical protein
MAAETQNRGIPEAEFIVDFFQPMANQMFLGEC